MPSTGRRKLAPPTPDPWGIRFQNRRRELNLTQVHVSQITGLTQQSISRIERNEVIPRVTTLELLAKCVGTTVEELFPIEARPRVVA